MHGGVYTSDPEGMLDINIDHDQHVNRYRFGTETAEFYVCRRCGVVPIVISEIGAKLYAVVNVNTLQNIDKSDLKRSVTNFDGETTESRLDRRSRTWIPRVSLNIQ